MKYFLTEAERRGTTNSTFFDEFFKGKLDDYRTGRHSWADGVNTCIMIDAYVISQIGLESLIYDTVPTYDPYGETEVSENQWNEICVKAKEIGGELLEAINETASWMEDNFKHHSVFTIRGL